MKKRIKCVRCETLERPQKNRATSWIKNTLGDTIPLCSLCILEIEEEEEIFRKDVFDEDEGEYRDEIFT